VFNERNVFIRWALFYKVIFLSCIFWIISSESSSSARLDIKFKLFIPSSIPPLYRSIDFGSLPDENTEVADLDSASLNWPSEFGLFEREDAHITPNRTARHKYPLLCTELELSLLRISESWDSSEVCEFYLWMHPLYNLSLVVLFFSVGISDMSSICSSVKFLIPLISFKSILLNAYLSIWCSISFEKCFDERSWPSNLLLI